MSDQRPPASQVALVTGAGSGIGRATVLALARAGWATMSADIDGDGAAETARMATELGTVALSREVDVCAPSQVAELVRVSGDAFGGIDLAFNNAGIGAPRGTVAETRREDLERVLSVNVAGLWNCVAEELEPMAARGGGVIVNTASATALRAAPGMGAYAMSKAAVVHLSRTVAVEYGDRGIRVHALCPGPIDTPMLARLPGDARARLASRVPLGRLGTVEEVAAAVVWLASPQAAYVSGTVLTVDGAESA